MSKMFCAAKMKSPPRLGACPGATNGMKTMASSIDIPLWRGGAFSDLGKINEIDDATHLALSERLERAETVRRKARSRLFPANWIERLHRRWSSFLCAGHIFLELSVDGIVVRHFHDAVFLHIFRISGLQRFDHPRILGGDIF
jgi:hypothetical protein